MTTKNVLTVYKEEFLKMWENEIKNHEVMDQFLYYFEIYLKSEKNKILTNIEKLDLKDTLMDLEVFLGGENLYLKNYYTQL